MTEKKWIKTIVELDELEGRTFTGYVDGSADKIIPYFEQYELERFIALYNRLDESQDRYQLSVNSLVYCDPKKGWQTVSQKTSVKYNNNWIEVWECGLDLCWKKKDI